MKKATNEMRSEKRSEKNSARRKLIPAIGMLTVSAMMLSSSTYAWFTMNKEVQVTGMELKTKVGSNLLICGTNNEADYSSDLLSEGRKALLEPVSTVSGKTGEFFFTVDAAADGHKIHTPSGNDNNYEQYVEDDGSALATAGKVKWDGDFNTRYGITPDASQADGFGVGYGYVDYVFYLKATSDNDNQQIRMTKCDLEYNKTAADNGNVGDGDKAWRVAVFATKLDAGQGGVGNTGATGSAPATVGAIDPAASTAKTILTLNGAATFGSTTTGTGESAVTTHKAVKNRNTVDTVTYGTAAVLDTIVNAGTTNYYKVTVRVWLEGEDTTCKSSTYAALTDNAWTLDLDFHLSADASLDQAVTEIGNNSWEPTYTNIQTVPAEPVNP